MLPYGDTQAARLERQFLHGKHADVVIRVRIAGGGNAYTDIKAHSVVLSASSAYFDRALSGEWTEAAKRRVELTVDDEEELEDLKLLIKLSYTDSFNRVKGELLPFQTRVRLAVRAGALEFVEAVDRIVASLPRGLDMEGALLCMENEGRLPPTLEAHAGMSALQEEVDKVLAAALGPVSGMFEEMKGLVGGALPPLRDIVKSLKRLPPAAGERCTGFEA